MWFGILLLVHFGVALAGQLALIGGWKPSPSKVNWFSGVLLIISVLYIVGICVYVM